MCIYIYDKKHKQKIEDFIVIHEIALQIWRCAISYFKENNATRGSLQVMVKVEFLALQENSPMLSNSFVYFYVDYEFTGMNLLYLSSSTMGK